MSIGPVEYIAIAFPGNRFSGEIVPAIQKLQDSGTIRVLDLVIITKDGEGNVAAIELSDADPEQRAVLDVLGIERQNLLGEEDFEDIGAALDPNSTAGLMIWENVWAAEFAKSLGMPTGSSSPTVASRSNWSRTRWRPPSPDRPQHHDEHAKELAR